MSKAHLTYALVTPARDEESNLARLAECLLAQTVLPSRWIVVDDGSSDGTAQLVQRLAASTGWIELVPAPRAKGALTAGRLSGRDVAAFEAGLEALPSQPDVVLKLDADVALRPTFFEGLLAAFEDDPRLGIAGGLCYEREQGVWSPRWVTGDHVRGATRAYRWACLEDVRPLEQRLGWDGIDEVKARLQGWSVRTIETLPFFHYRRMGERDGMRRAFRDQGATAYFMGYRPSYVTARALFRARTSPAALAMIGGYVRAALRCEARLDDLEVRRYVRDRQRWRELPRRAAEAFGRSYSRKASADPAMPT